MRSSVLWLILMSIAMEASGGQPGSAVHRPMDASATSAVLTATAPSTTRSDTIYLMGGPDRDDGKFQVVGRPSVPDWQGWTSVDLTARTDEIWHISTFNSPNGSAAMWCGEVFEPCDDDDPPEGYGNGYEEYLDWVGTVDDPGQATQITVTFDLNYDNEPGYDYLYLMHESAGGWDVVATYNGSTYDTGSGTWQPLIGETVAFTLTASDLVGDDGDEVHLRLWATTDGGWADSDCLWPTSGLAQIDNISVSGDNGLSATYDDFESGLESSSWQLAFPAGVGDFASIWPYLEDLDPCASGISCQVGFIDDGVVVPCTGGTLGWTWTYGPDSYVVNLTGGCVGPTDHLKNQVWSPPLAWVDEAGSPIGSSHQGAELAFDVYRHLPLMNSVFYVWHIRSSDDGGDTWSPWRDRNLVYYSNMPVWLRHGEDVTDLVVTDPTHVQIALGVWEMGWYWGPIQEATPAPYFDNVAFAVHPIGGPSISTRDLELAQDNFPTIGTLDLVDLGANHIRFDMAYDIIGDTAPAILPGDSITFDVKAVRPGSALTGAPRLHYAMRANPLFDPYRQHPTSGSVEGDTVRTATGQLVPDRFAFDLPDEDFFFPGDVIHYYIRAEDDLGGATTMPASLDGFGVYPGEVGFTSLLWPNAFTVRGLPTLVDASGLQPPILFWNDYGDRGGLDEWIASLNAIGHVEGVDYDIYSTNSPGSLISNGLGSRASVSQISAYETMLYASGDIPWGTISGFDQNSDKSDDLGLLHDWLQLGRNLLITGDNVIYDLANNQGPAGVEFISQWLALAYVQHDVSSLLGGATTPVMIHEPGNPAGVTVDLIAYGGCPTLNTFDAITVGTGVPIWSWEGHDGPEVAGVYNMAWGSRILTVPAALSSWWTPTDHVPPAGYAGMSARAVALVQILLTFGHAPNAVAVQPAPPLTADVAPNPFNPLTEIRYTVPSRGPVSVRVYNVRGELVRTLVDEDMEPGAHSVRWQGRDDRGSSAASGVYFYEVRTGGEAVVGKMSLVR